MKFLELLQSNTVIFDGAMGTLLQERGLVPGEMPERWNITKPEVITEIHKAYLDAGSNIVCTNTFGANSLKFSDDELESIIFSAVNNARRAITLSRGVQPKFIALDIGPLGKLLKPLGDLDFERAVEIFAKTVRIGARAGADLVLVETMNDGYETKAAVLAVKENCDLPLVVSNAYGEDGKLMTGATPEAMAVMLEGLRVNALGANCSLGPSGLVSVVRRLMATTSLPVLLKPNAGLPTVEDGKTVYSVSAKEFAGELEPLLREGLSLVGGCCGTTPDFIRELKEKVQNISRKTPKTKSFTAISSYSHALFFGDNPLIIGERINPTGKKRFKQALIENDIDYILREGVSQQERGAHILDVNVGIPDIDETMMLERAVTSLQAVVDLPLQIDTASPEAMEKALRYYNGKAMINSVNGKKESMDAIFPLVKKYGGVVVALTLDEDGIPATAEGRVEIAKRIIAEAERWGIDKKDIVFDTLTMTVSAQPDAATVTLGALKKIRKELGCCTVLGVSNVSFGLPNRDALNSTFFTLALQNGLSAAIVNPNSADMLKAYYSYRALNGLDENCADYIKSSPLFAVATATQAVATASANDTEGSELFKAIVKGFKERAGELTKELLKSTPPLEIVNGDIIPALNEVGEGFEKKRVFLPQLLMSAESAKQAFEQIKLAMANANDAQNGTIVVLATVKGDIHDIGKNIVKLLLENYGFRVVDLGKDTPPQAVVDAAIKHKAPLVGLSALMTTTVPAMEETIKLLREKAPFAKVVVGGAVLTEDYAKKIGADKYAKDGMETVRYAQSLTE